MTETAQLITFIAIAVTAGGAWAWPSKVSLPSFGDLFGDDQSGNAEDIARKIDEHLAAVAELRGLASLLLAQASDEADKLREIAQ